MNNETIDKIAKDGFSFTPANAKHTESALLSLKTALEAFSSSYQSIRGDIDIFSNPQDYAPDQVDSVHTLDYRQNYIETVVHFQHFAELVCKDLLREVHPLLTVDAATKPVLFHKLLLAEEISQEESEILKSIEFSETLNTLKSLKNARRLPDSMAFLNQHDYGLRTLNTLRNRAWHRGVYILRYQALDQFVTQCILPFVQDIMSLPQYSQKLRIWKNKDLHCGIDPIKELTNNDQGGVYNIRKVAFIKELLRASYENPIIPLKRRGFGASSIIEHNLDIRSRAEQLAKARSDLGEVAAIKECPVCGVKSLLLYISTVFEGDAFEPGPKYSFTSNASCLCCTFSVSKELDNPSTYQLGIEDYWYDT